MPQLLSYDFVYNQFTIQQHTQLAMYLGPFENQSEEFGQESFGLLEKSQFSLNPSFQLSYNPLEFNFDEVFLDQIHPKSTTISICTQQDRSYQASIISEDLFHGDLDHFFDDLQHAESEEAIHAELPKPQNPAKQNSLQKIFANKGDPQQEEKGMKEEDRKGLTWQNESDGEQRGDDAQNSHDQTKNIPKNYIKAIFTFVFENQEYVTKLLERIGGCSLLTFLDHLREEKRLKKYTIERLKSLWTHQEHGKALRIISSEFLRKRSPGYIFGSKIEKKMSHIRHRYKFISAIERPSEFTSIK